MPSFFYIVLSPAIPRPPVRDRSLLCTGGHPLFRWCALIRTSYRPSSLCFLLSVHRRTHPLCCAHICLRITILKNRFIDLSPKTQKRLKENTKQKREQNTDQPGTIRHHPNPHLTRHTCCPEFPTHRTVSTLSTIISHQPPLAAACSAPSGRPKKCAVAMQGSDRRLDRDWIGTR